MDQIISALSHLSLQDLSAIVSAITGVIGLFQVKESGTDFHIFIHAIPHYPATSYTQGQQQSSNAGCIGRLIIYLLFISSITYLIFSSHIISPAPSPSDQAKAVIVNFYKDVNRKDYRAAYRLLKDGLSHTYDQFSTGFAYTEHDDISFVSIKQLPTGTVQITITIKATENLPQGKRISTYRATYIVGEDHGAYIILKGTATKIALFHSNQDNQQVLT